MLEHSDIQVQSSKTVKSFQNVTYDLCDLFFNSDFRKVQKINLGEYFKLKQ